MLSYVGVLGYENRLLEDGVTVSVPPNATAGWSRPISNILTDKFITETARCTAIADLAQSQLLIDFHRARKISLVSLYALTVSLDAQAKLTAIDAELLSNPGPFTVVTGWTATSGGAALSVVAAKLRVTCSVGAEAGRAHATTLPGETYLLDVDTGAVSGGTGFVAVGSTATTRDLVANTNLSARTRNSLRFVATGTDTYIFLGNLTAGQSADFTQVSCRTIEFTLDWTDIHKRIYDTVDLDFEDDNWFTGKPTLKDLERYGNNWIYLPDQGGWSSSAIKIELDDHTNVAGAFDIGFGFAAGLVTPPFNYIVGSSQSLIFRTIADETPSGRKVYDRRKSRRTHGFSYDMLPKQVAMRLQDMAVRNDIVDGVIFVPTPNDAKNIFREAFLGELSQPPTIATVPVPDLRKVDLQIVEKVA